MAKEFAKQFYNSKAWRKCRAAFIATRRSVDGGMCQRCSRDVGYIVHHKEWLTPENINDPLITLNHEKLEYVCATCHGRIEENDRGYRFDEYGRVVAAR